MQRLSLTTVLLLTLSVASGDELQIEANRDATLYQSTSGRLANGAGTFFYAGRTGQVSNSIRRALISFDLSQLPADATVTAAELALTVTKAASENEFDYPLHRVLTDWGEGESDASSIGQGQGVTALNGEATWIHAVKPNIAWDQPGGDFAEAASDSISIGVDGEYRWGTEGGLLGDIEFWRDHPEQNFGWILIGEESVARTSKQFNSRTNEDLAGRPTLHIQFDVAAVTFDCDGNGVVDFADVNCGCELGGGVADILNELNLVAGDLNGNGSVDFDDFVRLSNHFGQAGTYSQGDIDCSGTVNFDDFVLLANHFGQSSSNLATSVPEPNQLGLLITGLSLLATRRRHCLLFRCCPPESNRAIPGGSRERFSVGREFQITDCTVRMQYAALLPSRQVPQPNGMVT